MPYLDPHKNNMPYPLKNNNPSKDFMKDMLLCIV